ncbi:MAG: hypothetical protein KAR83_02220 [Thermodesulfovibrionales bacterium]|nr:hypothetical protein [Thermodesulfovibrionales bacterium]
MLLTEISVVIGGFLSLLIAVFHTKFYSLFEWQKDFEKISPVNAKILYTIHLALLLLLFGVGFLSLIFYDDLAKCTGLGLGLMIMFSLLWLWRTIWQILFFNPDRKNKQLLKMHYILIIIFGVLFVAYSFPILVRLI